MDKQKFRFTLLFLLWLFVCQFLGIVNLKTAQATTITVTQTYKSHVADGEISYTSANYTEARDAFSGDVLSGLQCIRVGQGGAYIIFRAFLFFDTSALPSNVEIKSVVLSLYFLNSPTVDFNITVQHNAGIHPTMPLIPHSYGRYWYSGNYGMIDTTSITTPKYYNISLSSDFNRFVDTRDNFGMTRLVLRSNNDIDGIPPSTMEYAMFSAAEGEESKAPLLYVTYETEGYRYVLFGPYYEDGTIPNSTNVTVWLYSAYQSPISFTLPNGTSSYTVETVHRPNHFMWNITGQSYNVSRFFWLTGARLEEIYIFIPKPDDIFDVYNIELSDFVGVANINTETYLETILPINGINRVLERRPTDATNPVPFYLCFGHHYTLKLTCYKGIVEWVNIIPTTEATITRIITSDMFIPTIAYVNATCNAARINDTWIQASFSDQLNLTANVTFTLGYFVNQAWKTQNTTVVTANATTIDWHDLNETQDYFVNVTAYRNTGDTLKWFISIPAQTAPIANWEWMNFLGIWPVPAQYVFGAAIVLVVLAVFSTATIDAGCLMATLVAGFLNVIGWLNISWSLITLAACVSFLFIFTKTKKNLGGFG